MLTPQPPLDMLADTAAEHWVVIVMATLAVCALILSLVHWARSGRPVILLLFLAGGAMMVFEPLVDTVGGCWFPSNSWIAFVAWGRPMPVWLCLTYFVYFGVGGGLIWMALCHGVSRAQVWAIFVAIMVADFILENVLLLHKPYVYYGWQPLRVGDFPLWWAPVNGLIPLLAAAAIYRLESHLRGFKQILIIPLVLSVSAAVNAAAGWPSWLVINTDVGPPLTQLGGLATFALAFWYADSIATWVSTKRVS